MRIYNSRLEEIHELIMISEVPTQIKWNFIKDYYHSSLSNNDLIHHYSKYVFR